MIVTVTANPAYDITYRLEHLALGATNRVDRVGAVAGGKGVNVASVLRCMGYGAVATGFLGGQTADRVRADLDERGIRHDFVSIPGETRVTVNLVHDGGSTMLNEAGPDVGEEAWRALEARIEALLGNARDPLLVVSGSLPPGAPADGYARLIAAAGADAYTIVDASGPPLIQACAARPDLVKPNVAELAAATGREDLVAGARELRRRGADAALVTDGPRGLAYVGEGGAVYRARLATPLAGNPTGAGDALAASLAAAHEDGLTLSGTLMRAVAWSAAAVLHPVAGQVDPVRVREMLTYAVVEELS